MGAAKHRNYLDDTRTIGAVGTVILHNGPIAKVINAYIAILTHRSHVLLGALHIKVEDCCFAAHLLFAPVLRYMTEFTITNLVVCTKSHAFVVLNGVAKVERLIRSATEQTQEIVLEAEDKFDSCHCCRVLVDRLLQARE